MNIVRYTFTALCAILLFVGCKKNDVAPVQPSTISDITTAPLPGAIKISWTRNEPVKYEYIKITYFDKLAKKEVMRLASSYSDTILIPDTRAKYGDYSFTLQPFSITNTEGEKLQVTGKSGAAPKTITIVDSKPITLLAENLFTDAQEPSEGPIANLIDGKTNTFFHSNWSSPTAMPHYIVVKLEEPVNGFKFSYVTRNHAGATNHPKLMDVYASNAFDGNNYDVTGLYKVAEFDKLPNGATQTFNSGEYILDNKYQYIWFQVKQTHDGKQPFFALAQLNITELVLQVIDPEAPAEGD